LNAVVRWNGLYSCKVDVQRGTRQDSKLSPALFKIFLNDMLKMVTKAKCGITISDSHFNSFAFADDVTLFSKTVTGLQSLIDICVKYSIDWRFNFNTLKSQCMIMGENRFLEQPKWYMYGKGLNITDRFRLCVTLVSPLISRVMPQTILKNASGNAGVLFIATVKMVYVILGCPQILKFICGRQYACLC